MMKKQYKFRDLVRIMARLRGPKGCPWDREQTHQTLIRYLREESREVEWEIRKKRHDRLCDELGDLLLQVIFHAQLAAEKKRFTIHDVVNSICRKLIRRHPHVYGDVKLKTAREVKSQWEKIKRRERQARRQKRK